MIMWNAPYERWDRSACVLRLASLLRAGFVRGNQNPYRSLASAQLFCDFALSHYPCCVAILHHLQ
jgi:hypothetical protein